MTKILGLLAILVPSFVSAKGSWVTETGPYIDSANEYFSVSSAHKNLVASNGIMVGVRREWFFKERLSIEPYAATLLPWRSGVDGSTRLITSYVGVQVGHTLVRWLRVRYGTGLKILWQTSKGENVVLDNGTSTAVFSMPQGNTTGLLSTMDLALQINFTKRFSVSAEAWGTGLLNPAARRVHLALLMGLSW